MEINVQLLTELANLLKRYPPADWRDLADMLENDEARNKTISMLRSLADSGLYNVAQRGSQVRRPAKSPLNALKQTEPQKFELLTHVRRKLITRELLPTSSELRAFADKIGVDVSKERKREQAASKLIRALTNFNTEEIQNRLGIKWEPRSPAQSQYDKWVGVIMGKDRQLK